MTKLIPLPLLLMTIFVVISDNNNNNLFVQGQDEFRIISDVVPQDVSKIKLPINCPFEQPGDRPRVMVTIQPNTGTDDVGSDEEKVSILTYPEDLVRVKDDTKQDGLLKMIWNPTVAFEAKEGGIQIFLPPDQLKEVTISSGASAQILNGFTSITSISVSSDAKLQADLRNLTTSSSSTLEVSVTSDASAVIVSNVPVKKVSVSSDATLQLDAPSIVSELSISSDAVVQMKGNVDGDTRISSKAEASIDGNLNSDNNSISSKAKVFLYGSITGRVSVSSDAELYVGSSSGATTTTGSITGNVFATSDARVWAPSCDNVSTASGGRCTVDNDVNGDVTIEFEQQALTLTGTEYCSGTFDGDLTNGWAVVIFLVFLLIIICSCAACCYFFCGCCKKDRYGDHATNYPPPVPPSQPSSLPQPSTSTDGVPAVAAAASASPNQEEEEEIVVVGEYNTNGKNQEGTLNDVAVAIPVDTMVAYDNNYYGTKKDDSMA